MKVSDFDYELPPELIARYPTEKRSGARLMHLDASSGVINHLRFLDIVDLIDAEDLMIFNNTRVIPARFFGFRETGGKIEILLERVLSETSALAQIRASKSPKPGDTIFLDGEFEVKVLDREREFFRLEFPGGVLAIAKQFGQIPLPPYLGRNDEPEDAERYQTIFASQPGAVAAPTAGLHFDREIFDKLSEKGVSCAELTLHVGAGTFQPVRVNSLADHQMHQELVRVGASVCSAVERCRSRKGRLIAVGTTSVRSLEAASQTGIVRPFEGDTDLFIRPGYQFQAVDAMVTNFHLPRSTLLILVSVFAGSDKIQRAYEEAIRESYRFFSYGDAMLITR